MMFIMIISAGLYARWSLTPLLLSVLWFTDISYSI